MKLKILLLCLIILLLFLSFSKKIAGADVVPVVPPIAPVVTQVKTSPLFERIALCESGNDAHAKNPHSSASGRFQFLFSTWYYYGREFWGEDFYQKNVFNYKDNTDLAWYVFSKHGTSDWNESKFCWQ
jgi:hypothetical protein